MRRFAVKCCVLLLLAACSAVSAAGIRKVSLTTSPRQQLNGFSEYGSVHLINYLDAQVNMHADRAFQDVHRVAGPTAWCCPQSDR